MRSGGVYDRSLHEVPEFPGVGGDGSPMSLTVVAHVVFGSGGGRRSMTTTTGEVCSRQETNGSAITRSSALWWTEVSGGLVRVRFFLRGGKRCEESPPEDDRGRGHRAHDGRGNRDEDGVGGLALASAITVVPGDARSDVATEVDVLARGQPARWGVAHGRVLGRSASRHGRGEQVEDGEASSQGKNNSEEYPKVSRELWMSNHKSSHRWFFLLHFCPYFIY